MDAAVCLPVFLIAAGLLLLLLMQAGTEETIVRAAVSAAHGSIEADAAADVLDEQGVKPLIQGAVYWAGFHKYLGKEWDSGPDVQLAFFLPGQKRQVTGSLQADQLVEVSISSRRSAAFSLGKTDGIRSMRFFVFRPWRGESVQASSVGDERVYVFPKYGERYHAFGCRVMKEGSVEAILTESFKRSYSACKTCRPQTLSYGSKVFQFSDGSKGYHRKECACITKYYVSMPKSEALQEGYTACLFCQGGP